MCDAVVCFAMDGFVICHVCNIMLMSQHRPVLEWYVLPWKVPWSTWRSTGILTFPEEDGRDGTLQFRCCCERYLVMFHMFGVCPECSCAVRIKMRRAKIGSATCSFLLYESPAWSVAANSCVCGLLPGLGVVLVFGLGDRFVWLQLSCWFHWSLSECYHDLYVIYKGEKVL